MKTIILLHGALGSSEDLVPLAQTLENSGLAVYPFSFSGHGKSSFKTTFGIEQFSEELKNFILEKDLKNASVFGYSMGGFVALYLASKNPELIEKIITLGTKFNWSKESVDKETRMLDPDLMLEKVPAFAKSLELKHSEWRELLAKTAAMMRELGGKDLLSIETVKALNLPVLLGIADKDQMVTLDETLPVFKALPKASMYMLPHSKHPLESVNIDLLGKLIEDFLLKKDKSEL